MPRRSKERKDGRTIQYNTIKVRLYPTQAQEELFEKTFGCCRYIWNQMLSDQQRFYNETGKHFIPTPAKYKNGAPFLKEVDNQALTQEYNKLSQLCFFIIRIDTQAVPPALAQLVRRDSEPGIPELRH